jgi:hypothetical protein
MTEEIRKEPEDNRASFYTSERREFKRRLVADRREVERKKRFLANVVLPVLIGVLGAGLVSWGAYVTHTTYSISARYEETFTKHLERQAAEAIKADIRIDAIVLDYNSKIVKLHDDMSRGFAELRQHQNTIYDLLVRHEERRKQEAHTNSD